MGQTIDEGRVRRRRWRASRRPSGRLALAAGLAAWLSWTAVAAAEGDPGVVPVGQATSGTISLVVQGWLALVSANAGMGFDRQVVAAVAEQARTGGKLGPRIHGNCPRAVRSRLESGFAVAVQRVREVPTCANLFTRLGSEGLGTLVVSRYLLAGRDAGGRGCRSGVAAFTAVGCPTTLLCDGFGRLSPEQAAVILIHEALHTAGLTEWPGNPQGLRPQEINALVEDRCQL